MKVTQSSVGACVGSIGEGACVGIENDGTSLGEFDGVCEDGVEVGGEEASGECVG